GNVYRSDLQGSVQTACAAGGPPVRHRMNRHAAREANPLFPKRTSGGATARHCGPFFMFSSLRGRYAALLAAFSVASVVAAMPTVSAQQRGRGGQAPQEPRNGKSSAPIDLT